MLPVTPPLRRPDSPFMRVYYGCSQRRYGESVRAHLAPQNPKSRQLAALRALSSRPLLTACRKGARVGAAPSGASRGTSCRRRIRELLAARFVAQMPHLNRRSIQQRHLSGVFGSPPAISASLDRENKRLQRPYQPIKRLVRPVCSRLLPARAPAAY